MKFIAIGGEPGTGKSTLLKKVIEILSLENPVSTKKINNMDCTVIGEHVIILGVYKDGEIFGGTDRFPMNIQPFAEEFLKTDSDAVVIFEGDRLFNEKFLASILENHQLKTIILVASSEEKKTRYEARGSKQDEKWLSGRKTKIHNIRAHNLFLNNRYNLTVMENETSGQLLDNTNKIIQECKTWN